MDVNPITLTVLPTLNKTGLDRVSSTEGRMLGAILEFPLPHSSAGKTRYFASLPLTTYL